MTASKRPMRIMHVIDSLGRSGGAEQQLVTNLQRFTDAGFEHELLCLYPGEGNTRESEVPGHVRITYLYSQHERTRNRLRLIRRMFGAFRSRSPDLVHCALPDAALAARVAGRLTAVPVVESLVNVSHEPVHAVDNDAVTPLKLALHRAVDRLTMRWITRFHALSQEVARSWAETVHIPPEKITVIPRGVDTATLPDPEERGEVRRSVLLEFGLSEDTLLLFNIGRQVAQKGQIYVVRAMPEILENLPNAVFLSAGSAGAKTSPITTESAELGLADSVRLIGVRPDIPRLLAAADIFVFPSLYEGLGVSLLQAMASGLACVTTDRPPMTEVVSDRDTGLLVSAQDPAAIAKAVVELGTDHELRRRLGEAARQRMIDDFNSDDVAHEIEKLYRTVIETPRH